MPDSSATIRAARPDERDLLSALLVRSKASWGYDAAFMDAVRDDLRLAPDYLDHTQTAVLEDCGQIAGFCGVRISGERALLVDLFIDPPFMGRGHGARLLRHAIDLARSAGCRWLEWESDPHAEPFYLRHGARRIGETSSTAIAGRMLPVMRLDLS